MTLRWLTAERLAAARYSEQRALARAAAVAAVRTWSAVDPANIAGSWTELLDTTIATVTVAQYTAAAGSDVYVTAAASAAGSYAPPAGAIVPVRLAGVASDGRTLGGLLFQPAIQSLQALRAGASAPEALRVGGISLDMIVRTQVADAGRAADGIGIAARPQMGGYVRMLSGKSCSRCIVLAGKHYRWNEGFLRHPRCDCVHIPVGEDLRGAPTTSPRAAFAALSHTEQDRIFTQAGAQAIRDGGDLAQVVNARRGMRPGGITTESTSRRGGARRGRLMPEAIYAQAGGDRAEAIRLLRLHRYII